MEDMEENIRAKAKYAVINDYNNLKHPKVIINGEGTEFFIDSDGEEDKFGNKLDEVYKNLDQESNTLLDDINNTKEILDKLRSDAKDINDKIKKTQIQFDQKVKILDQVNLKTLNNKIEFFDEIASCFNHSKKCLGEILDKKYLNNSYIKTYPSKSSRNYLALRDDFEIYRKAIKTIKRDIIALYDETTVGTGTDNTLQRIKENQNLNLQTIKDASNSCNVF